jgi:hypothetical protein
LAAAGALAIIFLAALERLVVLEVVVVVTVMLVVLAQQTKDSQVVMVGRSLRQTIRAVEGAGLVRLGLHQRQVRLMAEMVVLAFLHRLQGQP